MLSQRNGARLAAALALSAVLSGCGDSDVFVSPGGPADTFAVTSTNRLVSFNRSTPGLTSAVSISGLQSGENIVGMDIRPADGLIYALSSTGRVYTIDSSGAATLKSTLSADTANTPAGNPQFTALDGSSFGIDFNPVVDRMRVISDTGQNLRINVDTGATITDGNLNAGGNPRTGLIEAGYTNSFAAACSTTLFFIDATTDRLVRTPDPNNGLLIDVGSLGVDAAPIAGFEIVVGNGGTTALAVFTVSATQSLYQIDLTSGAATSVGTIGGLNSGETVRGLALAPPSGQQQTQAQGDVLAVTVSNKLIAFSSGTPQKLCASVPITGLASGENVLGIDVRPADGMLYALTNTSKLYTIDIGNNFGQATLKSQLTVPLNGTQFGIDFNPVPDRLRIVSDAGQNLRVNVDSGAVTVDTPLNDVLSGPTPSSVTGAAYTNSFAGASRTTLYVLDTANDRLEIQGAADRGNGPTPNNGDLTVVGPLNNGDIQAVTDLEINGVNNTALAAVTIGNATTSELDIINLLTGAARRVNTIGGGEIVRGLTYRATRSAMVYGVTADNRMVSFRPSTPDTAGNPQQISGLQGGELIVGIDVRPSNNRIYALTDAGRLYTLDPTSAQATLVVSLAAASTTPAFSALVGPDFGLDFNPVVDRLRTVSSAAENLRTDTISGVTLVDGSLNPAPISVTAAAYESNFETARATRLFVIDTGAGMLYLQSPPNAGTLVGVGNGLMNGAATFQSPAGFDIVGGDSGLVLAALQPSGSTATILYPVNVTTGLAGTPLGTNGGRIGSGNGMLLQDIAIRLQ